MEGKGGGGNLEKEQEAQEFWLVLPHQRSSGGTTSRNDQKDINYRMKG